jgi:hypothetical protein
MIRINLALGLLFLFCCNVAESSHLRSQDLPQFSISQLNDKEPSTIERFREAIFDIGMFAIALPESQAPVSSVLRSFAQCLNAGHLIDHTNRVELEDLTLRTTFATAKNKSIYVSRVLNDLTVRTVRTVRYISFNSHFLLRPPFPMLSFETAPHSLLRLMLSDRLLTRLDRRTLQHWTLLSLVTRPALPTTLSLRLSIKLIA